MRSPDDDGIVVVTVRKDAGSMAAEVRALRETLGDEAMGGLQSFVDDAGRKWKDEVLALAAERFDRRLGEEIGVLRLDMARESATARVETAKEFAAVRVEMAAMRSDLRTEMAAMRSELRTEMAATGAYLRTEMASTRFSMLKWAFVFWVGQFAAISAMMTLLLRIYR